MDIKHRWDKPRIVSVEVGDSPAAWSKAGFTVDDNGIANVGGVDFKLIGDGGKRGVHACTIESDTAAAAAGETVQANGLTYHLQPPGTAPSTEAGIHPLGVIGIVKLEICPVETWATLTQLVHRVLPPPHQAFAYKNPSGLPQHVALWRVHNMEVFEMADNMGQTERDEMAMFFLTVADLGQAIQAVGKDNCSEPFDYAEGRKAVVLSGTKLDLSTRTFLIEPAPPTAPV